MILIGIDSEGKQVLLQTGVAVPIMQGSLLPGTDTYKEVRLVPDTDEEAGRLFELMTAETTK